jgi:hypothetical protein
MIFRPIPSRWDTGSPLETSVVASFEAVEYPLAGASQHLVEMEAWTGRTDQEVTVQVGIATGEGDLEYDAPFQVSMIDVSGGLRATELADETSSANGVGFFDYDQDGDDDLYVVSTVGANQLLRNDAGEFSDAGPEVGLADSSKGRGLAIGDYDGDGFEDVYLTNSGMANRLLRNDGKGRFRDVTAATTAEETPNALADSGLGRSAGFFDADGDGDLDLYFVNATTSTVTMPNRFYVNDGDRFREMSEATGLMDAGSGRGLAFSDVDGDADVDLFVASIDGSKLYQNVGGVFNDHTDEAGLTISEGSAGCVFGDYDNDGDVDLFVSNQSGRNQLFATRVMAVSWRSWVRAGFSGRGLWERPCSTSTTMAIWTWQQRRCLQCGEETTST